MTPAAAQPTVLPLFAWRELTEIEAERAELKRRIALRPPRSHRRVELQERLKALTTRELREGMPDAQ